MDGILNKIVHVFARCGDQHYGEEGVTQLQHAVQSGRLAVAAQADPQLVTAAVLHDIGHILDDGPLPVGCHDNLDDQHELKGYHFLQQNFGSAVADPVRLHVVAKRYLCTKHPGYEQKLSPTSRKSFYDQGGPMSDEQLRQFESEAHFRDALLLRQWDDTAKDPDAATGQITDFMPQLRQSLVENRRPES